MKKVSAVLLAITLVLFLFVSCGEFSVCDPNMMMGAASRKKNRDALTDDENPLLVVWGKNWETELKTEKEREWAIDSSDWMSKFYIGSKGKVNPFTVNEIVFCDSKSLPSGVEGGFDLSYLGNGSIFGYYKETTSKITFGQDSNKKDYYYCYAYILYIVADKIVANYFCDYMFSQFRYLKKITGLENLDTSSTVSMVSMFHNCMKLSRFDFLNSWDVSHVSDMTGMFENCSSVKTIDLSSWKPTRISNMNTMFCGCSGLTNLDISSFDVTGSTGRTKIFNSVPTSAVIYVNIAPPSGDTDPLYNVRKYSYWNTPYFNGWTNIKDWLINPE